MLPNSVWDNTILVAWLLAPQNLTECFCQEELLPMVQSKNLTLAFSSESSIEDELKRESTADAITISVRP